MNIGIINRILVFTAVMAVLLSAGPVMGQVENTSLLLQMTPAEGGRISYGQGLHEFEKDTEVTLMAVAQPGYQFVYWLGDVTSATSNSTVVYLDSPKIVIAVFERSSYAFGKRFEAAQSSRGGGGAFASAADYSKGGISPIARKRTSFEFPDFPDFPDEEDIEPEFPVPDESLADGEIPIPDDLIGDDDFPTPVPEPATIFMFGFGMLAIRKAKKRRDGIQQR